MSIVMGVDLHLAQITAEWIDVVSGEISRARVRPADRAGVRRFLERFAGQQLGLRLRRRPAGGSWSRSCGRWALWCISRAGGDRGAARQQAARKDRSR
jgi:hypothetical protein